MQYSNEQRRTYMHSAVTPKTVWLVSRVPACLLHRMDGSKWRPWWRHHKHKEKPDQYFNDDTFGGDTKKRLCQFIVKTEKTICKACLILLSPSQTYDV